MASWQEESGDGRCDTPARHFCRCVDSDRTYGAIRDLDEREQYYQGRGPKTANRERTLRLVRRFRKLKDPKKS